MRPGVPAPPHQGATGAQAQEHGSLAGREPEPPRRLPGLAWLFTGWQAVARWRASAGLPSGWSIRASHRAAAAAGAIRARRGGSRCRSIHGDGILGAGRGRSLPGATASTAIVGRAVGTGQYAAAGCSAYWWRLDAAASATAASSISGPRPAAKPDATADLFAADRILSRSAWSQVIIPRHSVVVDRWCWSSS